MDEVIKGKNKENKCIINATISNLLQLVDILRFLDVQLKEVQDSPEDIQHCGRDTSRCKDCTHNSIGILELDWCQ